MKYFIMIANNNSYSNLVGLSMVEGEGVMGSIFKGGGGAWETLMIFHFGCGCCFYVLESLGVSCENKFLLGFFFFFFERFYKFR